METIGGYQIQSELARDGAGVTYRAYDPDTDREVAIRRLRLEGATPEQVAASARDMATQVHAAARFQHPHAVAIYDFLSAGDQAYVVMELAGGTNLEAMIAAGGARNMTEALRILREAAVALDAAHDAGLVHGGITAGSILLDEAARVKIAGFGIANGPCGQTPEAAAPEQLRGGPLEGRSDQFALATVAHRLLTGQPPFAGETPDALSLQVLNEPHIPAREVKPGLPAAVDTALAVALQKEPARRFATCTAFVNALGDAITPKPKIPAKAIVAVIMVSSLLVLYMGHRAMSSLVNPVQEKAPEPAAAAAVQQPQPAPPAPDSLSLILDGTPMDFAAIPAGRFVMGCDSCKNGQSPEHMVEITRPFQLGRTEVTEKHWNAAMTGKSTGANKPKVDVSWNDTQQFLEKLNALNDGFVYRLPAEAEWEYAARATDPGERPRNLDDLAWTSKNSGGQLQEPASAKLGNGWGLYDMLGNASEWTNDWFAVDYYRISPPRDPKGPPSGAMRVLRGGNGGAGATQAGYAHRNAVQPGAKGPWIGFRVARERK